MFKKMKLAAKMAIGFGLLVLALSAVGGVGLVSIVQVQAVVSDLAQTHVPLTAHISTIDAALTGRSWP